MPKTIRTGDRGPTVELLQLALERAGYDPGAVDGVFGEKTAAALRAFQGERHLERDGIAGRQTWPFLEAWLLGYANRTVRPGDTLYRLAVAFGTTIRAIETANPEVDPLNLRPGVRLVIPYPFEVVSQAIRYTSEAAGYALLGLRARYPFLTLTSAGSSVLGAPLRCVRMGTGKPQLFVNGAHHANEWITTPLLLAWLERYCQALALEGTLSGFDARALYRGAALVLVPQVNPDGVDLVTGLLDRGKHYDRARAIASDYPAVPFPDGWKANIQGTDLNLQYPAGWELAKRIKYAQGYTTPAPRDFVGPAPLSAPESAAMYDLTLANDFAASLSYHTQGEVLYWRYDGVEAPGAEAFAEALAEASGYALAAAPAESDNAGYKDWFLLRYRRPAVTVEAGAGSNPLPLSRYPDLFRANFPLLTRALAITAGIG